MVRGEARRNDYSNHLPHTHTREVRRGETSTHSHGVGLFLPTGLYFLLPAIHINLGNLQVLTGSGGIICSLVDPCPFGNTGIEPTELDL